MEVNSELIETIKASQLPKLANPTTGDLVHAQGDDLSTTPISSFLDKLNTGILGSVDTNQTITDLNSLPNGVYTAKTSGSYQNGLVAKEGYITTFRKNNTTWTIEREVLVSAISEVFDENTTTEAQGGKQISDRYDYSVNSVSLRNAISYNNSTKILDLGDNFLFIGRNSFPVSGSVNFSGLQNNFYKVWYEKASNTIGYSAHGANTMGKVVLLVFEFKSSVTIQDINYSASNSIILDELAYNDYVNTSYLYNRIIDIEATKYTLLMNPDVISINYTSSEKKIIVDARNVYLFISGTNYKGTTIPIKILNQKVEFNISSDFMRLMYDLASDTFIFKRYSDFTNDELKNFINIGVWYFSSSQVYGFLENGKGYKLNTNVSLRGDGEVFIFNNSLKFGQIGDSITEIGDNKNGDKYTSVKYGYGRQICERLKIPFENHYPEGRNGRTTADYIDEWNAGTISFPNDLDLVTIMLGTNDWGKDDLELGTQNDYLNNTYSSSNRTTYGALRKIIDKLRSIKIKQIILITPMIRGAFGYNGGNYVKSSIVLNASNNWEFTKNSKNFTLKEVRDAILWVGEYENIDVVDAFNGLVDKYLLNMTISSSDPNAFNPDGTIKTKQDLLYDNLHPSDKGFRKLSSRVFEIISKSFY
ncbi:TPA: SGNH/GDSL hydrolase family protein [Elizabethkingia anophelis]|nr:hypothetical protein [Elizabethkingia anophelis]